MSSRELHHLRRAVEAASKIVKRPVIETQQPEPEPQQRPAQPPTSGDRQQ